MKSFKLLILLLGVTLSLTQCIDQEFDSPPLTGPTVDVPDEAVITIATLMEQFSLNNPVALDAGSYIRGAVVGSDKSGNIFKTLMVQDATAGIAIIIDDTDLFDTYYVGREVYIKLDNLYLGDFAGLPQLGMAPNNGDVSRIPGALLSDIVLPAAFNVSVTPTPLLLGQLNDAALNTLVQLDNVEFAAFELGETYATAIPAQNIFNTENRMISNCDGFEVILRSSGFSNFANTEVPSGNGTLFAILGKFNNDYQLTIRDLGDVNFTGDRCDASGGGGGGGGDPEGTIDEDFESGVNFDPVAVEGWDNIATTGERVWQFREFDNNVYAQATAFNDDSPNMETFLVTPEIDFDEVTTLSFRTAQQVYTHGGFEILFSANYTGDPNAATWETIDATFVNPDTPDHEWVQSGDTDISGFSGKGHISFKYSGSGPSGLTNSIRIDDVVVK